MNELFNFHDAMFVVWQNWFWLLLALVLGAVVGFVTCQRRSDVR
jgi:uncharacterized protein involved in exopolysaccharide biosynthesis